MKDDKKRFQRNNNKFKKPHFKFKKHKYPYPSKNRSKYALYRKSVYYILGEKRPNKPLTTAFLHRNKKIRAGIFFRKPTLKTALYPFRLNLKLINEYLTRR